MRTVTRRRFLNAAVAAGGAFAIGRAAAAPSDRIRFGLIGCGGRGRGLAGLFASRPDVECAYLCDPDEGRANSRVKALTPEGGKAPKAVTDFRTILDDKSFHCVIVATPDHWHALATVLACQAGKDVYVEKPASYSIWEGRQMVEAARKFGRVVQVGTQNRSAPYVQKAVDYVRSGKLGRVPLCKVYNLKSGGPFKLAAPSEAPKSYDLWLGPAPVRPFNARRFHGGWYCLWDYCGGDMGNDASHQIDIARWLIGKDAPTSVACYGGNLAHDDDREVPDTQIASLDFGDCVMTIENTQYARYMAKIPGSIREADQFPLWPQCATRIELYGTTQQMVLGRHGGGWQVFASGGKVVAQEFGRQAHIEHLANWADCIRSRKRPNADVEHGHLSAALSHLANIAYRVGRRQLAYDPKTETFPGDAAANRLVRREPRKPYAFPEL